MSTSNALVYDAPPILGLGEVSSDTLPEPGPGEVVIRVGAWSLQDLRSCEIVVRDNLMWDQGWYDKYPFSREKLTPGVYRVRLPVPDSNGKTLAEQCKLLLPGESAAPVVLAATVLLCHLKQTREDPLNNDGTRCAEALPGVGRVGLDVHEGRMYVSYYWDDRRDESVWLAGCQKS
jgi:hypothetical protein